VQELKVGSVKNPVYYKRIVGETREEVRLIAGGKEERCPGKGVVGGALANGFLDYDHADLSAEGESPQAAQVRK